MKRRERKKRDRKEAGRELIREALSCLTFAAVVWMPLFIYLFVGSRI